MCGFLLTYQARKLRQYVGRLNLDFIFQLAEHIAVGFKPYVEIVGAFLRLVQHFDGRYKAFLVDERFDLRPE